MDAKTEVLYKKVLEQFKVKFPSERSTTFMIDFETGFRNAFTAVYPKANIFSCWFLNYSPQKNIQNLGYTRFVKVNMAAKMYVKMTAALALLPAHKIETDFKDIKMYAQANNVQLPRFFTYFSSFWIIRKGLEYLHSPSQPRCTNNNVESFHLSIKQNVQVLHPNLCTFLEHIINIAMNSTTL